MKHTKGPWEIIEGTAKLVNVQRNEEFEVPEYTIVAKAAPIARIFMSHESNARLIAAAPEMLKILELISNECQYLTNDERAMIKNVFKKVRGE